MSKLHYIYPKMQYLFRKLRYVQPHCSINSSKSDPPQTPSNNKIPIKLCTSRGLKHREKNCIVRLDHKSRSTVQCFSSVRKEKSTLHAKRIDMSYEQISTCFISEQRPFCAHNILVYICFGGKVNFETSWSTVSVSNFERKLKIEKKFRPEQKYNSWNNLRHTSVMLKWLLELKCGTLTDLHWQEERPLLAAVDSILIRMYLCK